MRRHAESDNLTLLTEVLEGERVIALIAVNNKKSVYAHRTALRIGVEMLQPTYP
mgnify:CR=1 FL=1